MTADMHDFDFVRDAVRTHQEKVASEKIDRAWDVQAVSGVQGAASQRQFSQAGAISRKTLYEAVAGVCNASLTALVPILYEGFGDRLMNVDPATWLILIPAPWGGSGYRRYGLRSTEAAVLRRLMRLRQKKNDHVHWVFYDPEARRWCLNLADYPTEAHASAYLDANPVTARAVAFFWRDVINHKRGTSDSQVIHSV